MIQQKVNKYKQPARPVQQQKAGKSRSLTDNRPKTTVQQKQLSGMNPVVPAAPAVQTKTKNTGLPENLQTGIEQLSGISMNDVNVHYNSSQPAQLHAHAYAQGTDIHIAPGQEKHLPHEAWHVVQQKQGRVKPTMQLKGKVNVNNDKGLEQEADKMGAKAIARQTIQPRTISNARKNSTATGNGMKTIQPVWIIRNGKYVWENDPYQLKTGESYPTDFYQKPSVLVNEGSEEVTFDKKGQSQVKKRKLDIPTHKNLQSERENQGEELYKKIKVHPDDIEGYSTELEKIAEQLEKIAGNSVPSNHKQKVSDLFNKKTITGSDFRNIIKAQDEFTQSQSSAAFLRGLRKKIKLNKPKKTKGTKKTVNKVPGASPGITKPTPKKKAKAKHLNQYAKNVLRVMSSLRTTTQSVVAPVTHNKSVTGQQHPTSKDQPKLQGGSSGHSYSDRRRVQIQNEIFKKVAKDKNAPPNKILLASLLGSLVSTLSTMSAPTHATNLPEFNKSRKDTQQDERERVKKMANLLAQQLGIKIDTSLQDFDEPWKEHETPTSPLRNSSKKPRLPKKNVPSGQPIKEVVSLAGSIQWVATQLLAVMQPRNDNNDQFRLNFRNYVQQVQQAAALVDTSLPANLNILNNMYNSLNTIFRNYRNFVRRRSIQQNPAGNAGGLTGQRLPALEQFFAECGQMAVHNALVLRQFPDLNSQNYQQQIINNARLTQLGSLQNNISEEQIRQMLVNAHRPDLPVLGNIQQMAGLIGLLEQAGNGNLDAQFELFNANIGQTEQDGANAIRAFAAQQTQSLVLIVNTNSHLDIKKKGYHWITVRALRQQNGEVHIQYLDSLNAPANYQQLFHGLRQLLHAAPPQQHPQQVPQNVNNSNK